MIKKPIFIEGVDASVWLEGVSSATGQSQTEIDAISASINSLQNQIAAKTTEVATLRVAFNLFKAQYDAANPFQKSAMGKNLTKMSAALTIAEQTLIGLKKSLAEAQKNYSVAVEVAKTTNPEIIRANSQAKMSGIKRKILIGSAILGAVLLFGYIIYKVKTRK